MKQGLAHISLVVEDYDAAINFYCNKLNFDLLEDTYQPEQDKRWVVVRPPGSTGPEGGERCAVAMTVSPGSGTR